MTPLPNAESVARVPETMDHDEQSTSSAASSVHKNSENSNGGADLNMYLESDRLRTFENWPVPFIKECDLAAAGFYHVRKNDDRVRCPYCEIEVGLWVPGDEPFSEHEKHSPRCRFVLQKNETNNFEPPQDESPSTGEDTCGPYGIASNNSTARTPARDIERMAGNEQSENLRINLSDFARFPAYSTHEERLKSFENWPGKIPPDTLSMAGFIYSKSNDRTYCFHCAGSLHNWDDCDDPWIEHAHWFPGCKFILETCGQKFMDDAREKKQVSLARTRKNMKSALETIRGIVSTPDVNKVSPKNCKESSSGGSINSESLNIQDAAESSSNREMRMCLICMTEERNTVLLPCYHVVACSKCVNELTNCCVCREKVIYRRRIYLP